MSVKIGIWGVGFMGRGHGRILRKLAQQEKRMELVAVFDIDAQRRRIVAAELECKVVESAEQLLGSVDAVYLTMPNTLHAQAAKQAIKAGKHIFCEKPFTVRLKDAREVRDLVAASDKVFMVGHNRRFAPVYQAVKKLLVQEAFVPASAHFKMNRGELARPAWTADPKVTGGYLFETPLHLFDIARWLFGEVDDIQVLASQRVYSEADNFSLLFRFESGLSLTFTSCAHASWHFPFERIEVFGKQFTIETEEMERVRVTRGTGQPPKTEVVDFAALLTEDRWGYNAIDRNFIAAVLGEEAPQVTAEDGYCAVELVDRIYRRIAG